MTAWNDKPDEEQEYDRNYAGCLLWIVIAAALMIIVAGTWLTSEGVVW